MTKPKSLADLLRSIQWRPIETAPRDCSELIVFDGKRISIAFYGEDCNTGKKGWFVSNTGSDFSTESYFAFVNYVPVTPTHWMPLQQPPAAREAQGE